MTEKDGFSVVAATRIDLAVLDARQEGVLLRLGEAVDLVEEEDGLAAVEVTGAVRLLHHRADVLDPGRHRGQLDELAVGGGRDEVGERRLARARRAPEDRREGTGRTAAAGDEPPERAAGTQHLALAADLLDRARTHPDRERRHDGGRRVGGVTRRRAEEVGPVLAHTREASAAGRPHRPRRPHSPAARVADRCWAAPAGVGSCAT